MKTSVAIMSLISAAAFAVPASATVYIPGSPEFSVTPATGYTIYNSPTISGTIAVDTTAEGPGTYTDDFQFIIPQTGVGSGAITTTANFTGSANFINILAVSFNGLPVPGSYDNGALFQYAGMTGVPITTGATNNLVVTYTTNGTGTYGGNLTFDTAAVPEPATWAMFLLGFGFLGLAFRRKLLGKLKTA